MIDKITILDFILIIFDVKRLVYNVEHWRGLGIVAVSAGPMHLIKKVNFDVTTKPANRLRA